MTSRRNMEAAVDLAREFGAVTAMDLVNGLHIPRANANAAL